MTHLPFSVLLPVYAGDSGPFLKRAFESVTTDQERPPDEVVIVRDGPVPAEVEAVLDELVRTASVPVQLVALPDGFDALDAVMADQRLAERLTGGRARR